VTPLGLLLLTGGLLAWGVAYEGALGRIGRRSPLVGGALSGLGAYAFDKKILPDRVVPSFRRAMGPAGTAAKYVALGLSSAAASRWLSRRRLAGRRIAVLAADGFEKIELTVPLKALRAEGAEVEVISLRRGKIVGMHVDIPSGRVRVDRTVGSAEPADYDGLFVPGGFINPDFLRQSEEAREFVRAFHDAGKPIAVICHGPWVLASAGVLRGRRVTSWPGIRDDLVNAGAIWRDEPVVRDGSLLSSRGPQDIRPFLRAAIDLFAGRGAPPSPPSLPATSSPQPTSPPAAALAGAAILPRVQAALRVLGTTAALAAGAAALLALRRSLR
jgi:protease I